MSNPAEHDSIIIHKLLTDRSVPVKEVCLPKERPNIEAVEKLYDDVLAIRETLRCFARGEFDIELKGRGAIWGYLKALQANLNHLAWQVEQVAAGDFSQRVDFMGNFSTAFNKLTQQLEISLEEMKNRETAERMQIMFDATPLCCSFWNEERTILDCNLEAVKLHELNSKQEYCERFFDLSPTYQPDGSLSTEVFDKKLSEAFEKGYARYEHIRQKFDGELIPVEVTLVRVLQQDHYIVACYIRDLRELKQQQAVLDQQRLLLLDVLNSSPICFAILVNGRVKFSSEFMKHFLGLEIDEYFLDCFADQVKGVHLLAEVKEGIRIEWEPITIRAKEHGTKEMLANLFLTNYYGDQGIIIWLVDITEIKKIEADLRSAKETAERLSHVKDEFIANMSHELRTPMNAVFGILHLLQNTSLSEEQTSFIGLMEASAKSLLKIINNMLDFSKLESGKVFMASEKFDVREILEKVLSVFREETGAKNLQMFYAVEEKIPELIIGDPRRLQQILHCLVDNAVKFTTQGSVEIQVHIESLTNEDIVLWFAVKDTGIGISPENQERIFHPFSQGDNSETRKYGGAGLGLTVANSLVKMMGGRIWCTSEVQQGATFFFIASFKLPQGTHETIEFPESFQGLPLLLVEDNKINQIVASKMLQEKGFCVDIAPNGLLALEMVKQKKYALILMDIQMPEMDGLQVTREIRSFAEYASLPIIALTANAMEDDRLDCLAAGMNDHVAKPIDPATLFRTILKWVQL